MARTNPLPRDPKSDPRLRRLTQNLAGSRLAAIADVTLSSDVSTLAALATRQDELASSFNALLAELREAGTLAT